MTALFWRDILFRIGLYRGIKVPTPPDLIICTQIQMCPYHLTFQTSINMKHRLAVWLCEDCMGPWAMRMRRPLYYRHTYLAFARHADAMTFRLLL
jgi:hypothetical protein